jgi:hypothetical protein
MPPGTRVPSTVIASLTRTPKHDEALAMSASIKTNGREPNSKGANGSAAKEPDSMEINGGEPDRKRFKHEEMPMMNGGDTRTTTKKERKAAKKAEKKARKERKREKQAKKKAKS